MCGYSRREQGLSTLALRKMFGHPAPMREDESPEGLSVHSAGQGEQGYYVYDVWESREAFERFMEEKLGPALAEVMGGPAARRRDTAVLPHRRADHPALSPTRCWRPIIDSLARVCPGAEECRKRLGQLRR